MGQAYAVPLRFVAWPFLCFLLVRSFDWDITNLRHRNPKAITMLMAFGYTLVMCCLKFLKFNSFNYEFYDFGLYLHKLSVIHAANWAHQLNLVFNSGHMQPSLIIFAFICDMPNWPYWLLILQTTIYAMSVIPLYLSLNLSGRQEVKDVAAVIAIYLLNPLVSFNDILGFHPENLVFPCVIWGYYFFRKGNFSAVLIFALLLATISEQWIALSSSMLFGFSVLQGWNRKYFTGSLAFAGLFFLAISHVYFDAFFFKSAAQHVQSNLGAYVYLTNGDLTEMIRVLFEPKRLFFFYFSLLPFIFLLVSVPRRVLIAVALIATPEILKIGLSGEPFHYAVEGHYSMGLIAALMVAVLERQRCGSGPSGGSRTRSSLRNVVALLVAFLIANSCWPLSVTFWTNANARTFHVENYQKSASVSDMQNLLALISPLDPKASVHSTNGAIAAEFVMRQDFAIFGTRDFSDVDFVVIDFHRNKSAGSGQGEKHYMGRFDAALSRLHLTHEQIFVSESYVGWRNRRLTAEPEKKQTGP